MRLLEGFLAGWMHSGGEMIRLDAAGSTDEWISSVVQALPEKLILLAGEQSWIARPLLHEISAATLLVSLALFLVVALLGAILSWAVWRRVAAVDAAGSNARWEILALRVVRKPLYLVFWTYGIYASLFPLLTGLGPAGTVHPIRAAIEWWTDLALFAAIIWLFYRCVPVLEARLQVWAARTESLLDDLLVPVVGQALRIAVPVMGVIFALPLMNLGENYAEIISRVSSLLIVGLVTRIAWQTVQLSAGIILERSDVTVRDNLRARKLHTQVHVLRKTLLFIIVIFSMASVLMLFEEVRRFGTSLLASAGVVGIIIGFAAQRTIANLFAGLQLALTQPIRLDDVVIVEGEWGRIEEITLTYVVVAIWDRRRLIVPISYFIEKPFQNWTRVSADILGSVFLHVDYTAPLDELRKELRRIAENSPQWDRKVCVLQVTNATDRTLELRALASAADASQAWDLRCEIREKLVSFIQRTSPQSLPRSRAAIDLTASGFGDGGDGSVAEGLQKAKLPPRHSENAAAGKREGT